MLEAFDGITIVGICLIVLISALVVVQMLREHEKQLQWYEEDIDELLQALIDTAEYVGQSILPPMEGWSWYEQLRKHEPEIAKAMRDDWERAKALRSRQGGRLRGPVWIDEVLLDKKENVNDPHPDRRKNPNTY